MATTSCPLFEQRAHLDTAAILRGCGLAADGPFTRRTVTLTENGAELISIGKVPDGAEGWLHATEDNFTAARILLPAVQRKFTEALGKPFLLSLTHRDDCFCWSLSQSLERQQKHIREALERFLQEDYNLTPDILLFADGMFSVHMQQREPKGHVS